MSDKEKKTRGKKGFVQPDPLRKPEGGIIAFGVKPPELPIKPEAELPKPPEKPGKEIIKEGYPPPPPPEKPEGEPPKEPPRKED